MEYFARTSKDRGRTLIEFPDCPGCITFAEKGEDVHAVAAEALELWLTEHLSGGVAPPPPSPTYDAFDGTPGSKLCVSVPAALAITLQIRWRRQQLGLSQEALGKRLSVSRQQVAMWENPESNLTVHTIERVASALAMELSVSFRPVNAVALKT